MRQYITYIKYVLVVFIMFFIFLDLRGDSLSDAQITEVVEAVNKVSGFAEIPQAENRTVKRFYGLNPSDYEGVVLYAPQDNMDVHELLIVKVKDISQNEMVEAAIQERLDTQLTSFEGYGAEQVALLKKHVLDVKGNYIFFMVGENTEEAHQAFLDSL
ncbi:MAG: DUF4358 domain-containing protein [Ruminococcus sp.]|nr:DUF4358 domain-containing protein [Ruminococcus sp.]